MAKSPDAFRTISEVADWLGIQAHVLRFWESKFTQVKPVKRAGGRRYYRPADMLLLGGIKKLLHDDGLTIKGVQKILREHGMSYVADMSQPLDDLTLDVLDGSLTSGTARLEVVDPEPETGVVLPFAPGQPDGPRDAGSAKADASSASATGSDAAEPDTEIPATSLAEHDSGDATGEAAAAGAASEASGHSRPPLATGPGPDATPQPAEEADIAETSAPDASSAAVQDEDAQQPADAPDAPVRTEAESESAEVEGMSAAEAVPEAQDGATLQEDASADTKAQDLPHFVRHPMTTPPAAASDNMPAPDTSQAIATDPSAGQDANPPEPGISAPDTTRAVRRPRVIALPPLPVEAEMDASPSALTALSRLRRLTPAQADAMRPLIERLTQLRGRTVAARKDARKDGA